MPSRPQVHAELQSWIDQYPTRDLDEERLAYLRANRPVDPAIALAGVDLRERHVGPRGGAVRVLLFTPQHAKLPMPAVIHIHGGGYVMGKPEEHLQENAELAQHCGCMVISVDYRLAPENPYPGGLDDCHTVLAWLHASAPALGVDRARIALKGESAGGGLAACLAQKARDEGRHALCAQILIAPMLDDRPPAHANPYTGEFVWTENSNRYAWQAYLGQRYGADTLPPYAAACRAKDLGGLPPLFLAVGALDLFFDQDMDYVQRLNRAGVTTELHVYPGAFHSFQRAGQTSLARRLRDDYRQALEAVFGAAASPPGGDQAPASRSRSLSKA